MFGSPESALAVTGRLAAKTGFRAISLDYRLATEHPFPAAIEDALRAYRRLGQQPTDVSARQHFRPVIAS